MTNRKYIDPSMSVVYSSCADPQDSPSGTDRTNRGWTRNPNSRNRSRVSCSPSTIPAQPHPVIYPCAPFHLLSFDLSTPQRDQNSTDRVQYARLILSIEPKHHHRHPRTHKEPPISIKHHNIICPNPNYKHSAADKPPTQHLLPTHHRNPNEHRRSSSPTCFLASSHTTGGVNTITWALWWRVR